jgi:hypothetical protein
MVTYNSLQQKPINQIGFCTFRVSGELLRLAQSLTPLNFMVTNYYRFTGTACSALSGLTGTGNIRFFLLRTDNTSNFGGIQQVLNRPLSSAGPSCL